MNTWTLRHPTHGLLEVKIAPCGQLSGNVAAIDTSDEEFDQDGLGAELLIDGHVVSRVYDLTDSLVLRNNGIGPDEWDDDVLFDQCVDLTLRELTNEVHSVVLTEGRSWIEFDAPKDSPSHRWQKLAAKNPNYALVRPLLTGLEVAVLGFVLLMALKLIPFLPDPILGTSQIVEMVLDLFEQPMPQWLSTTIDYSRVWLPILLGLITAVGARRTAIYSTKVKREWELDEGNEPQ
ncbi:hypothetical protein [Corynebacterium cystitidis]|uniref:hypothetical protein n=1 Tax=Corynebacterium cystitidis TaxID=35757 RepID=UPI00115F9AA1|nr:hypothetical protein [Corynebacterium cystitidis]